tara:strand:- start:2771 stop:3025 length:255 start_codon:yes stop_codon:yes gene_type:complete
MESKDYPLIAALAISVGYNLPQLYKVVKTKDVAALSTYTMVMRLITQCCWVAYAALDEEYWIMAVSSQNLVTESLLLILKCKYS